MAQSLQTNASQALPTGWSEAFPGGLACSADPVTGGIIDNEIVSKKWFVIFNREDLPTIDGLASRDDALHAYVERMSQLSS